MSTSNDAADVRNLAAKVITGARNAWAGSGETDGGADAFDYQTGVEWAAHGRIARYGELYMQVYILANEGHPARPGITDGQMAARNARADALWDHLLPELERYAEDCRKARYSGWSMASGGPIRRIR